jgi:hypothetical protein
MKVLPIALSAESVQSPLLLDYSHLHAFLIA